MHTHWARAHSTLWLATAGDQSVPQRWRLNRQKALNEGFGGEPRREGGQGQKPEKLVLHRGNYRRRPPKTKEEERALIPGNSWKPEGTHLAAWARLSRVWIRASPSLFRLSKRFSFEVIWNKKKERLSKAEQEIPLSSSVGWGERETSYSICYTCKWNVTLKRPKRKSLLPNRAEV